MMMMAMMTMVFCLNGGLRLGPVTHPWIVHSRIKPCVIINFQLHADFANVILYIYAIIETVIGRMNGMHYDSWCRGKVHDYNRARSFVVGDTYL